MTESTLMVLPDVQSSTDRRNIPIQKVGVKGIRTPILVKSQSGAQHTVAHVEMYVALPADKKGTHMSRFWTLLGSVEKCWNRLRLTRVTSACASHSSGRKRRLFPNLKAPWITTLNSLPRR